MEELADQPKDIFARELAYHHSKLIAPSRVKYWLQGNENRNEVAIKNENWKSVSPHHAQLKNHAYKVMFLKRDEKWVIDRLADINEPVVAIDINAKADVSATVNFAISFGQFQLSDLLSKDWIEILSIENVAEDPDSLKVQFQLSDNNRDLIPSEDRPVRFSQGTVVLSKSRHLLIKEMEKVLTVGRIYRTVNDLQGWPSHRGRISMTPGRQTTVVSPSGEQFVGIYEQDFGNIPASEFTLEHFGITGVPSRRSPVYFWWAVGIGGGVSLIIGLWLIYRYRGH